MTMAKATRTGKKQCFEIGKTTTLHVRHAFLYISLPSLHNYNVKVPKFMFCRGRNTRQQLSFPFPKLWHSLLEFNSRKICQHLMNWTSWNKCDKVWSTVNSLFKWRFHSRPCHCCLSSLILIAKVIRKNVNRMKCTQSHTSDNFFSYWFCFLILIIIKVVYLNCI